MSGPTDELWERGRMLAAERMRPEPPPPDHLRSLIELLDRLLTNPPPADRHLPALPPGPPDRQETTNG